MSQTDTTTYLLPSSYILLLVTNSVGAVGDTGLVLTFKQGQNKTKQWKCSIMFILVCGKSRVTVIPLTVIHAVIVVSQSSRPHTLPTGEYTHLLPLCQLLSPARIHPFKFLMHIYPCSSLLLGQHSHFVSFPVCSRPACLPEFGLLPARKEFSFVCNLINPIYRFLSCLSAWTWTVTCPINNPACSQPACLPLLPAIFLEFYF